MDLSRPVVIEKTLNVDDRGYVYGAFDNMDKFGIKRTYVVENIAPRFVRAWHGHRKAGTFIHVISGVAKVAAVAIDKPEDYLVAVMTSHKPALLYIPPGFYNGAMTLIPSTKLLVYSTITLDECKADDVRAPMNSIHPEFWQVEQR